MPIFCLNISPKLKTFISNKRDPEEILFLNSFEELYKMTKSTHISSIIIEMSFLDHDLENQLKDFKVCLIYEVLPEISKLKQMHEEKKSFYLTDKNLFLSEYDYILAKLKQTENYEFDWLKDIPENLFHDYYAASFKKLETIQDLIVKIKLTADENFYIDLKEICHKISGSAGIYGHMEAGNLCKEIELKLKNKEYQTLDLNSFFRKLYLFLQ